MGTNNKAVTHSIGNRLILALSACLKRVNLHAQLPRYIDTVVIPRRGVTFLKRRDLNLNFIRRNIGDLRRLRQLQLAVAAGRH